MSKHLATVDWRKGAEEDFLAGRYSRVHTLRFDGGATVVASASPGIVGAPWSSQAAVDPEELFVASLSSCHMLWFLDFARRAGVEIRAYSDEAVGEMARRADGRVAVTRVTLRPLVEAGADPDMLENLHHQAHDACFIANSVTTEVAVEPRF